jgi:hypothetical protein
MTEKQRALQAKRALALLGDALELLEDAAYSTDDPDDSLWWAYDRFNEAHHKAVEVDLYDINGKVILSPHQRLLNAIADRL